MKHPSAAGSASPGLAASGTSQDYNQAQIAITLPLPEPNFANGVPRVLIADDQADVRAALALLLKSHGFYTESASSPAGAMSTLEAGEFDVVLMDLNYARDTTSGQEGLSLLERIREYDATLPIVVMTAWGSIELAVETMRKGARDFVQKPWENERLLAVLGSQVELGRALRKGQRLEAENRMLRAGNGFAGQPRLIAHSAAMKPVLEVIRRVAPSEANILITGEHGTGKEVIAQTIHSLSHRKDRPMVTLNTGGLAEGLFESELFGHVKGAFTDAKSDRMGRFELAHGGTLFLDEIANVPLSQQAKLLRVLQTGEMERLGSSRTRKVDVRILSATNSDLQAEAASGGFRQDLLFRLNTVEVHLPPLRERREDIPILAMEFLKHYVQRYRKEVTGFQPTATEAMLHHRWTGNVRELEHAIERAVLLAHGESIEPCDLALRSAEGSRPLEDASLEEVETLLIRKALNRFQGNISNAAEALGLSRSALYRRLQKYGI